MRLLTAVSGFLSAALLSAFGGPTLSSAVFAPESRYTDLVGRSCQTEPVGGDLGAGAEQTKRCPGLGGAKVVVTADHSQVALGYEWSAREKADEVLAHWSLGYKLEWRGFQTSRGFDPYATVIRVLFNSGAEPADRPVLAVMRVRRGEACVMAVVDIASNPDAYELARQLADSRALGFVCGRDAARVEGIPTARATQLLAGL